MSDFVPIESDEGSINIVEYPSLKMVAFESSETSKVEIPMERLRDVIAKLQSFLPMNFNEVALVPYDDGPTLRREDIPQSLVSGFYQRIAEIHNEPDPIMLCPECAQGKVQNCAGVALLGDDFVPCKNAKS